MSSHMDGGNYSAESKNNNPAHYEAERKSFGHQQYAGNNGAQYGDKYTLFLALSLDFNE